MIEGTLNCLDEFNLTGIRLDIKSGEELIIHGVVNKLRISNNNGFVGIVIVIFKSLDAHF